MLSFDACMFFMLILFITLLHFISYMLSLIDVLCFVFFYYTELVLFFISTGCLNFLIFVSILVMFVDVMTRGPAHEKSSLSSEACALKSKQSLFQKM